MGEKIADRMGWDLVATFPAEYGGIKGLCAFGDATTIVAFGDHTPVLLRSENGIVIEIRDLTEEWAANG